MIGTVRNVGYKLEQPFLPALPATSQLQPL